MPSENLHELAAAIRGHDLGMSPAANTAWRCAGISSPLGGAMDWMLDRMQYVATLLEDEAAPDHGHRHKPVATPAAFRMIEMEPPRGGRREPVRPLTPEAYDALVGYLMERRDLMARALVAVPGHAGRFVHKEAGKVADTTETALRALKTMGRPKPDALAILRELARISGP